ncbi:ABC transporter permease [Flexibacterium corallicola]|uniref:ABC transporter permease n=1 Tax=Flexibacterium corallicola TaxID=3037259 RepID=UPI00286EE953|nr:ABC transporter permease [Pseudovibrio sp. M1P-2-3]
MVETDTHKAGIKLALRFALREMRGGLKGFYIFIACIALGVTAIAGVASVSRALTEGILQEGQSILGGDISFSVVHQKLEDQETQFLEDLGPVSQVATLRAMARTPDARDQTLVELKSVDDFYPLYGTVRLESGQDPTKALAAQAGDFWPGVADPSLLTRLDLSVGDTINVGRILVRIVDRITAEPDKLSGGLSIGPRLMISQEALQASDLLHPGSLVRYHYRLRFNQPVSDAQIIDVIESAKQQFPNAGWRIRSRTNAAPNLQRNVERFAQFLTLVGLTSLIVGGVGVANAVRSYLETKKEVIASLKSLGASGDFVFQIYLIQILILASIGIVIGLFFGAIVPFIAIEALSNVLPIEAAPSIYPAQLFLGLVYGLLTALTFAIWPLGRAHDVPPTVLFRDQVSTRFRYPRLRYIVATLITVSVLIGLAMVLAYQIEIAVVYLGATVIAYLLLLIVARLIMWAASKAPTLRSTEWRLAISNIHRPGALTPSVVLSLGLGLTLLVALALIDGNIRQELTQTANEKAPSFFFMDIQNHEKAAFDQLIATQAPSSTIETVPMLRGRLTSLRGIKAEDFPPPPDDGWVLRGDRGITYSEVLPENSTLTDGKWWPLDYTGEPLVSFDWEIAQNLGLKIGDMISVNVLGREISARIANLRTVDWQSLSINFVMVFSPNTFAGAPHTHLATVAWEDAVPLEKELNLLKQVSLSFPTITAVQVKDAITQINNLISQLSWAIRGASSITLIASILVLGGALAAGHKHRIYDAVILKTLGATRARLIYAYFLEYMILGMSTAVFALLAGSLSAYFVMTEVMNGTFTLMPGTAIAAITGALLFTVGFGLFGTWRVLAEKPAPVLRDL